MPLGSIATVSTVYELLHSLRNAYLSVNSDYILLLTYLKSYYYVCNGVNVLAYTTFKPATACYVLHNRSREPAANNFSAVDVSNWNALLVDQ
jgi:hypothetical protein